ncbi:MAG: metallophosphoesterase [Verrucomicrobiae bacterium]|nr:metallophosphoesterase [Verrucomicrobiae bacterium]
MKSIPPTHKSCYRAMFYAQPIILLGFFLTCSLADELAVMSRENEPFSFLVLSDLHYSKTSFEEVSECVRCIAIETKALTPAPVLVGVTGDLAEGGTYQIVAGKQKFVRATYLEMKEELEFALRDVASSFNLPVLIAPGNHDKMDPGAKAYRDVVLPCLSKSIGLTLSQNYFSVRYNSAVLIFLDSWSGDYKEQNEFLQRVLAMARQTSGINRLFVFAHPPLWRNTISAQQIDPLLTSSILPALRSNPTDAYFCGHIHRLSVVVRHFEGAAITQVKGALRTGCQDALKSVIDQQLIFPRNATPYYWAYFGGCRTYYVVRVLKEKVSLQLRACGRGVIRECEWVQRGQLRDVQQ